jgi:hypothetical protein
MKTPSLGRMATGWMIAALSVSSLAWGQAGSVKPVHGAPPPKQAVAVPNGDADPVTQAIRGALRVSTFTLVDLDNLPQFGTPSDAVLHVRLGDVDHDLVVSRFSMRSKDFRVLTSGADGKLEEVAVGDPITFRGTSAQDQSAVARVSIEDGRVEGTVALSNGTKWGIYPMSDIVPGAPTTRHVVYQAADIYPTNKRCGVDDHGAGTHEGEGEIGERGTGLKQADLAMEVDNPYYVLLGSNVQNVVNDVETTMNNVEAIYENDVAITYEITTIHVWTDAADPYSGTVASGILNQFQAYWNSNFSGIRRDVAHMFTGTNLDDPVLGIAQISSICTISNAYGLVQTRWSLNTVTRACLSAHELGHGWSAQHCDGQANCNIMCSALGGCTGICTSFGVSISQITSFRGSRTCLFDLAEPIAVPFTDDFTGVGVNTSKWSYNFGAGLLDSPIPGAPSSPRVLRLNSAGTSDFADDEVRSNFILAHDSPALVVAFSYAKRNVEAGKTLNLQYWASNLRWNDVTTITSDGVTSTDYTRVSFSLPADASHNELRIRFRVDGTQPDDEWFVDDVYVGEPIEDAVALPLQDHFPSVTFDPGVWSIFQGDINTLGVSEPSLPNSAELDGSNGSGEQMWTKPLLAGGMQDVTLSYWVERRGVDLNESLVVEARDNTGAWSALNTLVSPGGADQTVYAQFTHVLNTPNFLFDGLRFRWRSVCNNANDNWYIDDVNITGTPVGPVCIADFNNDGIVNSTDVSDFINQWFQDQLDGTFLTDWDHNGVVNSTDVSNFINDWFAAPPECTG